MFWVVLVGCACPAGVRGATAELTGVWQGDDGKTYRIEQEGTSAELIAPARQGPGPLVYRGTVTGNRFQGACRLTVPEHMPPSLPAWVRTEVLRRRVPYRCVLVLDASRTVLRGQLVGFRVIWDGGKITRIATKPSPETTRRLMLRRRVQIARVSPTQLVMARAPVCATLTITGQNLMPWLTAKDVRVGDNGFVVEELRVASRTRAHVVVRALPTAAAGPHTLRVADGKKLGAVHLTRLGVRCTGRLVLCGTWNKSQSVKVQADGMVDGAKITWTHSPSLQVVQAREPSRPGGTAEQPVRREVTVGTVRATRSDTSAHVTVALTVPGAPAPAVVRTVFTPLAVEVDWPKVVQPGRPARATVAIAGPEAVAKSVRVRLSGPKAKVTQGAGAFDTKSRRWVIPCQIQTTSRTPVAVRCRLDCGPESYEQQLSLRPVSAGVDVDGDGKADDLASFLPGYVGAKAVLTPEKAQRLGIMASGAPDGTTCRFELVRTSAYEGIAMNQRAKRFADSAKDADLRLESTSAQAKGGVARTTLWCQDFAAHGVLRVRIGPLVEELTIPTGSQRQGIAGCWLRGAVTASQELSLLERYRGVYGTDAPGTPMRHMRLEPGRRYLFAPDDKAFRADAVWVRRAAGKTRVVWVAPGSTVNACCAGIAKTTRVWPIQMVRVPVGSPLVGKLVASRDLSTVASVPLPYGEAVRPGKDGKVGRTMNNGHSRLAKDDRHDPFLNCVVTGRDGLCNTVSTGDDRPMLAVGQGVLLAGLVTLGRRLPDERTLCVPERAQPLHLRLSVGAQRTPGMVQGVLTVENLGTRAAVLGDKAKPWASRLLWHLLRDGQVLTERAFWFHATPADRASGDSLLPAHGRFGLRFTLSRGKRQPLGPGRYELCVGMVLGVPHAPETGTRIIGSGFAPFRVLPRPAPTTQTTRPRARRPATPTPRRKPKPQRPTRRKPKR